MGYKKMGQNFGFANLELESSLKHNRSLKTMEKLDKAINCSRVEEILINHYTVGTSSEGADAYPPSVAFQMPDAAKVVPPQYDLPDLRGMGALSEQKLDISTQNEPPAGLYTALSRVIGQILNKIAGIITSPFLKTL